MFLLFLIIHVPAVMANSQRPNILLLMAEDMNQHVGAFGDPVAVTPELDKMAAAGVRYTNTFTTAGVCAPSRAALIMGAHQITFGAQHQRTDSFPEGSYRTVPPATMKAFPELLRGAGYYTFTNNKLDYQFSGPLPGSGPFTIWDEEGHNTDWHNRPLDKPFFGYMNFLVTHESGVFAPLGHWPHSVTQLGLQLFRAYEFGVPEENTPVSGSKIQLPPYYPDTPTVRSDIARHYNNIAQMDGQIGRILAQLKTEGLLSNTIVIWAADNGDGLPRAKREVFDTGVKVPMIILWPEKFRPADAVPGTANSRMISFVDLAPTILSLAGATVPEYMQGRNFTDPAIPERRYIYAERDRLDEVTDRQRLVRDRRFAYIYSYNAEQGGGEHLSFRDNIDMMRELRQLHDDNKLNTVQSLWFQPSGRERLYDTVADPYQIHDLANDSRYAPELARMRAEYRRWRRKIPDMSDEPEGKMMQRFFPNGEQPITEAPQIVLTEGKIVLHSDSEGASIGYRLDEGHWQLFAEPVAVRSGQNIETKAVRYGWQESPSTKLTVP